MGAKKSTVCTSAKSSEIRKTPASSKVSLPTSNRGSVFTGSAASARDRSPGPIFDAQPAQRAKAVSLKSSSRVLEVLTLSSAALSGDDGYCVDFHQRAARKRRHLHRRAGRTGIAEPLAVNLVDRGKVREIVEIDGGLDDIVPRRAGGA